MDNYYFTNAYGFLSDNAQEGETIISFDLQSKLTEEEVEVSERERFQDNTRLVQSAANNATPSTGTSRTQPTAMSTPTAPTITSGY